LIYIESAQNLYLYGIILNSESRDRHSGYGGTTRRNKPSYFLYELLRAIHTQAEQEHASRSGFVTGLGFIVVTIGQQLQENASRNNRTLAQELEQSLGIFQEQLPVEQINQLAIASQRSLRW